MISTEVVPTRGDGRVGTGDHFLLTVVGMTGPVSVFEADDLQWQQNGSYLLEIASPSTISSSTVAGSS